MAVVEMPSETRIHKFLNRTGGVELLIILYDSDGLIIEEVKDTMSVAAETTSNRIAEAREVDLIEINRDPQDHGNAKRYTLTARGKAIHKKIGDLELNRIIAKKNMYQTQYEMRIDDLKNWLEDHTELTHSKFPPDEVPENAYDPSVYDLRD